MVSKSKKVLMAGGLKDWVSPDLEKAGIIGGEDYAATMSYYSPETAYLCFNSSNTANRGPYSNPPSWLLFYTPKPVYITKIYFASISSWSSRSDCIIYVQIQGSNDGIQYDTLNSRALYAYGYSNAQNRGFVQINSINKYKYIRFYCSGGNKNTDAMYLGVKIYGKM